MGQDGVRVSSTRARRGVCHGIHPPAHQQDPFAACHCSCAQVAVPGEAIQAVPVTGQLVLGAGLVAQNDEVFATRAGVVQQANNRVWLEARTKRYARVSRHRHRESGQWRRCPMRKDADPAPPWVLTQVHPSPGRCCGRHNYRQIWRGA